MSQKIENLKLGLDESLEEKLALLAPGHSAHRILRKSIDARRRGDVHQVLSVEVFGANETPPEETYPVKKVAWKGSKPVIVGAGPGGLFAAVRLVERGIPCILLERGSNSVDRLKHINRFWRYGEFNAENNVCFGEGGAGLYSDGKLITRIKSPHIPYILHRLVQFGAPKEIRYLGNPHVGSDRIRRIIPFIRKFLTDNGCEIHFDTKMSELILEGKTVAGVRTADGREFRTDHVILATGHSARDTIYRLHEQGVAMEGKSFAMGLRIEHPQTLIDNIQFREASGHPALGAANYKLTCHDDETGIGVYSFCMCPGGYVLSSGTDADAIVCNGMSNYHRNSPFANSAVVVTVDFETHFGKNLFGGFDLQRKLETSAFQAVRDAGGTKEVPVQSLLDFLDGRESSRALASSCPSGVVPVRLDELLPEFMLSNLKRGLEDFEKKMKGFRSTSAQLHGVESRTSCPIRIVRNTETLQSLSHPGLYPIGEGAGYAGGITSAAVDGVRAAEAIVSFMTGVEQFDDSPSRASTPPAL